MLGNWTVLNVEPIIDLVWVLLSRDVNGQPEDILLNVLPNAFGEPFMVGDTRGPDLQLVSRTNETPPSPLSQKI